MKFRIICCLVAGLFLSRAGFSSDGRETVSSESLSRFLLQFRQAQVDATRSGRSKVSVARDRNAVVSNDREGEEKEFIYFFPIQKVPFMENGVGESGAYFKTRVVIYNPTEFEYEIYATLYGSDGEVDVRSISISGRTYKTYENFLESVFGYTGQGAVEFDSWFDPPDGSSEFDFDVRAEVYTESVNGGRNFMAVKSSSVLFDDEDRLYFMAIGSRDVNRSVDIMIFNDSFSSDTFFISVGDGKGNVLQKETIEVLGNSLIRVPVIEGMDNGYIRVLCGSEICWPHLWMMVTDNLTSDRIIISPTVYSPPQE